MADFERQHSVSKFYLRRFAQEVGNRQLWQYAKSDPFKPRPVSPAKATTESYFYSIQRDDGTWDHSTEHELDRLESRTAPAIDRLLTDGHVDEQDRIQIGQFIGVQWIRTRGMRAQAERHRKVVRSPDFTENYIESDRPNLEARYGKKRVDDYISGVRTTGIGIELPKNYHLVNLMDRGMAWGQRIALMGWMICRPVKPSFFVTSDNPAFVRRPDLLQAPFTVGINRADLQVELGFPLSSNAYLLASWKQTTGCRPLKCSKSRVKELNRRTVLSAYEHVFARENAHEIQKLVDERRNFQFKYGFQLEG